jgi:hypothetical protein
MFGLLSLHATSKILKILVKYNTSVMTQKHNHGNRSHTSVPYQLDGKHIPR